ncbi:MAG: GGDEF domain-containing protein [Candidatus Omnitrophota bacterium]
MFESLSILSVLYVIVVLTYIRKLINNIRQDNEKKTAEMRKIHAGLLDQQKAVSANKGSVETEAIKIFTLYDMTREITKSLSQQDAFEIFKEKLQKHVRFGSCELISTPVKDKDIYKEGSGQYVFPLKSKDTQMGYIRIDDLNPQDKEKAAILCHQFALALRRVRLYEEIERTAITDSLTDMYTRRYTLQRLEEEIGRSKARRFSLAFLMIDVDRFKDCNDNYGHLVGDQILREIGQIIKQSTREIDIPGRFGGEEFCVVLPDTDIKGAKYVAERIRSVAEGRVVKAYDATLSVTVSIGIATFPADARKKDELIDKADWSLYKAKKQGRNRVCSFGE